MQILDGKHEGVRRWRAHAESLEEVQRWLSDTPRKWSCASSQSSGNGSRWDLGVGYSGAMRLAKEGWSEGARDLSARIAVGSMPKERERAWRYDVAGDTADIGRFLSGDPANMMRHSHVKGHRPIVSLAIGANACGGVSATEMANYGAAMVALIDKIEASGRRVHAVATYVSEFYSERSRICPSWVVKRSEDPLDLASLAFSLAHPAAFRRLGFAIYERSDVPTQPGYGRSVTSTIDDLIDPMPNTLVISGLADDGSQCKTLEGALRYAAKQINTAAGETLVEVE